MDRYKMDKRKLVDEIKKYLESEKEEAGDDAERIQEIERLLMMYRFLPIREYGRDDVVVPSALVELRFGQTNAFYFIVPSGGGLVTRVEGRAIQVITPQSPLGEILLGRRVGDRVSIEMRGGFREYEIVGIG